MISFSLQNFGCRVNQAEAFDWAEEFQRRGLRWEAEAARSDLVVVNTCTLTSRADRDVRKFLARVVRENPGAKLIVTGCLVDRARSELEGLPQVTLLSNAQKADLAPLVLRLAGPAAGLVPVRFRARGLLKVQDGCDGRCTFCIIPSVRGRSRSLSPAEAVGRLQALADRGYAEVVLTGIHLSSYGLDLRPRSSLLALLREMEERCGGMRLRLSSLDPRSLDRSLREFLAGSRLVRPHFHLSLQHGSDPVLARMGRKSRAADYREILEDLRRASPEASLGADIITGFPGESDEDFRAARDFVRDSPLNYVHVFSYSPRPGTAASSWPRVDAAEVKRRTTLLRSLSLEKSLAFRRSFLGKTLEAVVIRTAGGRSELLTGNYIKVYAETGPEREGDAVRVVLDRADDRTCWGRIRG